MSFPCPVVPTPNEQKKKGKKTHFFFFLFNSKRSLSYKKKRELAIASEIPPLQGKKRQVVQVLY
jgi:hypothetical protein